MRTLTLAIACLVATALGAMQLKDGLKEASNGDYIVTVQDRTATLLVVRETGAQQIVLEEVTAPVTARGQLSWTEWVEAGGPGHAAWSTYLLDLKKGRLERAYSYSRRGWIDVRGEQFLTTLMCLPFHPVSTADRRRVGLLPHGGPNSRPVWNPPLIVGGNRRPATFDAYTSQWPRDGSPLAGREVTLYLPHSGEDYPSYLPYWLEVRVAVRDARLRAIDSGRGLSSPKTRLLTPR